MNEEHIMVMVIIFGIVLTVYMAWRDERDHDRWGIVAKARPTPKAQSLLSSHGSKIED